MSRAAERLGRPKRVEQFAHWDEARERRRAIAERRKKPSLTAESVWQATTTTPILYGNTWFTTNITTTITAACNDLSTYFTILGDNITNAATTFTNTVNAVYQQYSPQSLPVRNLEQIEAQRRRVLRNERLRSIATRRGRKLLVNLLSPAQRADYAKTGTFLVAAESGRLYRLRKARTALELDPKTMETIASLCVHMTYGFIAEDSMIANLLALETDEEAWRKTANISPRKSGIPYSYSQGAFADLVAA